MEGGGGGGGGGGRQWQAVNPACPNASNPFHRCADYCPTPTNHNNKSPATLNSSILHSPGPAQNGVHSDGEQRPKRRSERGGSGGLPLYVFLRDGSDGEGRKVDPKCPNASNPYHVCTEHCLAKMNEVSRSDGGKSPKSLFSRHSRHSSSSEDNSVKSGDGRKVDRKCPNASNPFHECAEYCASKSQETDRKETVRKETHKTVAAKNGVQVGANWKVDPRCPNASNPYHICAQYCFDHLNETAQAEGSKSDSRKGKAILKAVEKGDVNPDCVNASNPYHTCGEYCSKRKDDR